MKTIALLCSLILIVSCDFTVAQTRPLQATDTVKVAESTSTRKPSEQDALTRLRPPSPSQISEVALDESIHRGVNYLVSTQRKDGAWGGPQWTGGVDNDPVPGSYRSFDIAVTAMCLEALLDAKAEDADEAKSLANAKDKAFRFLMERTHKIRRAGLGDLPHIWAHCYCIQTFCKMYAREIDKAQKQVLESAIRDHMKRLERWESIHGGWFYYGRGMSKPVNPSCSFVNAAVLVAFARARDVGITGHEKLIKNALRATRMMRKPDSSYVYSARIPTDMAGAARLINRPAGSLGRSQACNIALRLWNDDRISDDVIRSWLNRMVSRHGWLDMGRKKPIPHESFAAVAGYFYYFGVYYGTVNIEALPQDEHAFYQHHFARLIIDRQEKEGSWFDYPLYSYHKPYGTAFAILGLQRCRVSTPLK